MAKMFYTTEEAMKVLKVDQDGLKELVNDNKLREFRDGARMMFKVDQVDRLAEDKNLGLTPKEKLSNASEQAKASYDNAMVGLRLSEHLFNTLKAGTFSTSNGDLVIQDVKLARGFRGMYDGPPETVIKVNDQFYKLSIAPVEVH